MLLSVIHMQRFPSILKRHSPATFQISGIYPARVPCEDLMRGSHARVSREGFSGGNIVYSLALRHYLQRISRWSICHTPGCQEVDLDIRTAPCRGLHGTTYHSESSRLVGTIFPPDSSHGAPSLLDLSDTSPRRIRKWQI